MKYYDTSLEPIKIGGEFANFALTSADKRFF